MRTRGSRGPSVRRLPVAVLLAATSLAACTSGDDTAPRGDRSVGDPYQESSWTRRAVSRDFTVEAVGTAERAVGDPLDVAFDDDGAVWVIGEFGSDLAQVEDGGVTPFPTPYARTNGTPVGPFANPFHREGDGPNCAPAARSALAERVIVTEDGHVWFTHGGALFPPSACRDLNHSRLVRFDPAAENDPATPEDERFCVVPVPGVDGQVIGVAHDPETGRIWFSAPTGTEGPALGWFVEEEARCRNQVDYADPEAVDAAVDRCPADGGQPGCIHLVPLDEGIAPAHVMVDPETGFVWFTDYRGQVLGRHPLEGDGTVEQFPLPPPDDPGLFGSYPWQVRVTPGAVYFVEFDDNQIVRFDTEVAAEHCTALVDDRNPCMQQVTLPVADALHAHSLALDGDRLWFTAASDSVGAQHEPAFGYLDLRTWEPGRITRGVLYDDLRSVGPAPDDQDRALRGIDVEPTTGRLAVADRADEVLVLTPR